MDTFSFLFLLLTVILLVFAGIAGYGGLFWVCLVCCMVAAICGMAAFLLACEKQ